MYKLNLNIQTERVCFHFYENLRVLSIGQKFIKQVLHMLTKFHYKWMFDMANCFCILYFTKNIYFDDIWHDCYYLSWLAFDENHLQG